MKYAVALLWSLDPTTGLLHTLQLSLLSSILVSSFQHEILQVISSFAFSFQNFICLYHLSSTHNVCMQHINVCSCV